MKKVVGSLSLTLLLLPTLAAASPITFNLRDPFIETIDEVNSFPLTISGLTATLTAFREPERQRSERRRRSNDHDSLICDQQPTAPKGGLVRVPPAKVDLCDDLAHEGDPPSLDGHSRGRNHLLFSHEKLAQIGRSRVIRVAPRCYNPRV